MEEAFKKGCWNGVVMPKNLIFFELEKRLTYPNYLYVYGENIITYV